jgi:hypothetical protein
MQLVDGAGRWLPAMQAELLKASRYKFKLGLTNITGRPRCSTTHLRAPVMPTAALLSVIALLIVVAWSCRAARGWPGALKRAALSVNETWKHDGADWTATA